jgi:hypothetical protein
METTGDDGVYDEEEDFVAVVHSEEKRTLLGVQKRNTLKLEGG